MLPGRGSLRQVDEALKRTNPASDFRRLFAAGFPSTYAETEHPRRRVVDLKGGFRPLAAPGAFRRISNLPIRAFNWPNRRNGVPVELVRVGHGSFPWNGGSIAIRGGESAMDCRFDPQRGGGAARACRPTSAS
jgi:hypothetical protein